MSRAGPAVRPVAADDRAAWDRLWQNYLSFYGVRLEAGVSDATWARLLDPLVDVHGLMAWAADGRPVGLCHYLFHPSSWAREPYCYLEDLYVDGEARGRGAGRALIEAVYAAADARPAKDVYWMTEEGNAEARRLYDRIARRSPFVRYLRSPDFRADGH